MSKRRTTGRRYLRNDIWHDDNGEIPGSPAEWDPPMTPAEKHEAAASDPDNPPSTPERLARARRVSRAKQIRWKLGLSREEFSERYRIPLATLSDWERHELEPDETALAFLLAIEREPEAIARALAPEAA